MTDAALTADLATAERVIANVRALADPMRSAVSVGPGCYLPEGWHALCDRLLTALDAALPAAPTGEGETVSAEQEFVPCIVRRQSFVDLDGHIHTCTLDNDHVFDRPEDGHACPCGWFWHE